MNTIDQTQIKCYLENISPDGLVHGWALNPQDPNAAARVYIYINQQLYTVVEADQMRADLKDAGIRDGRAGFMVDIAGAQALHHFGDMEIRAYLDSEQTLELPNSPLRFSAGETVTAATDMDPELDSYTARTTGNRTINCYFEGINAKGELYGWACDPRDMHYKPTIYLFCEESPLGSCQADQFRGDLKSAGISNGEAGFNFGLSGWELGQLTDGTKIHAYLDPDATQALQNSPYILSQEVCDHLRSTADSVQLKRLTGTMDNIKSTGEIVGWARDPHDAQYKARVYLFTGPTFLGSALADEYRGDLQEAGLNEGKCAFTWKDYSFDGLSALGRSLQVRAYFDPKQQRELSQSPVSITRAAFKKVWKTVLDQEKMDTYIEVRSTLLREMLVCRASTENTIGRTSEEFYHDILQLCQGLYKARYFDVLLNVLTPDILEHRKAVGLPVFDLWFYRLMTLLATEQLETAVLQGYQGLIYREMEAMEKLRRDKLLLDDDSNSEDDQSANREDEDEDELDLLESEDSVDLKGGISKNKSRKLKKGKDPVRERYRAGIDQACIENFNQLVTNYYTDQPTASDRTNAIGLYIQMVARCLMFIYRDYHLAVNYINVLGRDNLTQKSSDFYVLAGRINQRHGSNYEALQYFFQATRLEGNAWRACNEACSIYAQICEDRIELYRQKCEEVTRLLTRGLHLNPQQSQGYKYAAKFHRNYAALSIKYTRQLADCGEQHRALQERENDLTVLAQSVIGLQHVNRDASGLPSPVTATQRRHGTLVFMASQSLWQCFYYRAKEKLDHARTLGWTARYVDFSDLSRQDWKKELMYADALYLCRLPATYEVLHVMGYARSLNIPIIYDIDDLIFDEKHFPSPMESYAGTIDQELHTHLWMDNPLFRVAMKQADVITCSTEPLAEQIRALPGLDKPVILYPNLLSEELKINALKHQIVRGENDTSNPVNIFYGSATKAHKQVFYEVLCPALAAIMARHPTVQLTLIGYFNLPNRLQAYTDRISIIAPSPNYMGYIARLKQADINIAILEQDTFTDCKSELKWFEAGAFGIPSVVTPTATYRHVLTPEENVLFATDTGEWIRQLTRLVESPALRHDMGERAKRDTFAAYQPAVGVDILKNLLDTVLQPEPPRRKIRLLFVNVFFAPQSIGGATRIVESHIRHLMEKYPDEFEIHVLTTEADPSHWPAYSVEQYLYGEARVTKLRIPAREWAEHQDERIYTFCLDYYRRHAFDMIHFHSIQVLTASAVDAAQEMNIPYLITLHDGWWLSRYLFLMDNQGNAIDPADPFSGSNAEQDDMLWLLERKNRLHSCLADAYRVLAVSDKFRLLHEAAMVEARLQTNENGLEMFELLPRKPYTSHRVRLAHIGGMSRHKGYDLLRDTITTGQFANMEVRVIDHGLEPGESYRDYWGTTPVIFQAKFQQTEVNTLYSEIDVLVAPSLWPESFGLVTREALYAGIWVVASDRGAIGDAIEDGVSGRVIDVATPDGLMAALREIDATPEEFTRQRPSVMPTRTAADQAEECAALYRSLAADSGSTR